MNIQENNKLIADFLGEDHELNQCIAAPNFHKSWDWLKPVIKKCWRRAKALDISFDKMMEKYRFDYIAYGDLDESYESVVEFIRATYNKTHTMKNLELTEKEVKQLFLLLDEKVEQCKEGTPKQESYEKLADKLWKLHPSNN